MSQTTNPLSQYFRQPAIYLKLPTNGDYWPESALSMPHNRELPVLPMTAIDEITYRTPDALFNGQAVVGVIQSCIPSVTDAWRAPVPDINAMLIAVRIASYGHNLDVTTTCPNCSHEEDYSVDLRKVLDQIRCPDYKTPLTIGDLEIRFQPIDYGTQNAASQQQFDDQKMIQVLPELDIPEQEKIQRMREILKRLNDLTVTALVQTIQSIRASNTVVTEPEFIKEYLHNCDRKIFNAIRDHVIAIRSMTDIKPLSLKCPECEHEYQQPFTLDMTSFFEPAS